MSDLKALIGRLNPTCRRALETAAGLCVAQTHYNVEVEHLLLKLLDLQGSDLEQVLKHYEVPANELSQQLESALETFDRGNSRTPAMSPQVLQLLRQAWVLASLELESQAIRSGAMLLALYEDDGLRRIIHESCPVLARISRAPLREHLRDLVRGSVEDGSEPRARAKSSTAEGETSPPPASDTPSLDRYTLDLTADAEAGRIDPIRGRDTEIRQVVDILTRRRQNNPILVGDAGVGKTAIAEGFALAVAAERVPRPLRGLAVKVLDLGLLQAGAGVKGEFEERLKSVIAEVKDSPKPIILFIDEAHTLIGAGGSAGQGDAANLLKPALARGELRTIAATTWSEYKKYFEKDPALTRRFQLVKVEEPDEDNAIDMLRGIAPRLEEHHRVTILDQAVREAVALSHRYLSERRLPDKAISVLDTACARVALAQEGTPATLDDLRRRIRLLDTELEIVRREGPEGLDRSREPARLASEREELEEEAEELEQRWRREQEQVQEVRQLQDELGTSSTEEADSEPTRLLRRQLAAGRRQLEEMQNGEPLVPLAVDGRVVASVISGWTGIPAGRMLADEVASVLSLEEQMGQRLVGQGAALEAICRRISTSRAGLEDPSKPKGVFLLVGPTGVGKTETALTLAELLYGGERNLVTVNMSEFQEAHSLATLKGAPPGYVGYGRGGVLTEAVRRRPYSVVLLDEIEKAHSDVVELFYQVFDKGVMEDGEGVPVDFKNTVILMTSNAGGEAICQLCAQYERSQKERSQQERSQQERVPKESAQRPEPQNAGAQQKQEAAPTKPTPEQLDAALRPLLQRHFQPAFLGRLVVVPYYPLAGEDIRRIARLKLAAVERRVQESHGARLTWDEELLDSIARLSSNRASGARSIEQLLDHTLLPTLSNSILERLARGEVFERVHISADALESLD